MANTTGQKFGGRTAGTPNKRTMQVNARLQELGCDPLELSAKIATGQELDGPHPALEAFYAFANTLAKLQDKGSAVTEDLVNELRDLIENNLTRGYVPMDLRSKHIADLMRYAYPRLKAVQVDASVHDKRPPRIDPSKMSDEAIGELLGAAVGDVVEGEVLEEDESDGNG